MLSFVSFASPAPGAVRVGLADGSFRYLAVVPGYSSGLDPVRSSWWDRRRAEPAARRESPARRCAARHRAAQGRAVGRARPPARRHRDPARGHSGAARIGVAPGRLRRPARAHRRGPGPTLPARGFGRPLRGAGGRQPPPPRVPFLRHGARRRLRHRRDALVSPHPTTAASRSTRPRSCTGASAPPAVPAPIADPRFARDAPTTRQAGPPGPASPRGRTDVPTESENPAMADPKPRDSSASPQGTDSTASRSESENPALKGPTLRRGPPAAEQPRLVAEPGRPAGPQPDRARVRPARRRRLRLQEGRLPAGLRGGQGRHRPGHAHLAGLVARRLGPLRPAVHPHVLARRGHLPPARRPRRRRRRGAALRPAQQLAGQRQPRQGPPPAAAGEAEVRPQPVLGRPAGARGQRGPRGHGLPDLRLRLRPRGRLAAGGGLLGAGGHLARRRALQRRRPARPRGRPRRRHHGPHLRQPGGPEGLGGPARVRPTTSA